MNKAEVKGIIIIIIFLIINIALRSLSLTSLPDAYDPYDEGVYLYSAKLINNGQVPYRDFELVHPPFYIYFLTFLQKLNLSVAGFRMINIVLSSLVIIFIYLIARKISQNYLVPIASLVFYTASPSLFLYSRVVILEPIMTLFIMIALYSYFANDHKKNKIISAVFLVLACLVRMTALFAFLGLFIIIAVLKRKNLFKEEKRLILTFLVLFIMVFLALLFIPHFFDNVIMFQLTRSRLSWLTRLDQLKMFFKFDFLLLGIGFIFSLILLFSKNYIIKTLSFLNVFTFIVLFFLTKTFYAHYLIQIIPTLSIILALAAEKMLRMSKLKYVNLFLLAILALGIFNIVRLANQKNDVVPQVVNELKKGSGYLYTANPSFALSSGREITPWYFASVSLAAYEKNVPSEELIEVMNQSKTILFDSRSSWQLPQEVQDYVLNNFNIKSKIGDYKIFEGRKTMKCQSCQNR